MILLSSLLFSAAATPIQQTGLDAQKPVAQIQFVQGQRPRLKPAEVMLSYYRTRVHVGQVTSALSDVYDSLIVVDDGSSPQQLTRWLPVDDHMLLIRDTAEHAREIIEMVRKLEDLLEPPKSDATEPPWERLTQIEYRPRALSADATRRALAPYQRSLTLPPPADGSSTWIKTETIHVVPERNVLVIRDLPERLDEIRAFLARIDVPAAQVDVACWIVRGKEGGASSKSLPQDLVTDLARIVPSQSFELAASSRLRASISEPMKLESGLADRSTYALTLVPAAFDEQRGELSLSSFTFEHVIPPRGDDAAPSSNGFQGGATLRANEYTVLGAVGENPLYVVLSVQPVK